MPPVLTVDDVAALLNTSRRAVYRLVEGGLPHFRLDTRQLRFREHDIEAWINGRVTAATSPAPPVPIPVVSAAPDGVAPVDWSKRRRAPPPTATARPSAVPKKHQRAASR